MSIDLNEKNFAATVAETEGLSIVQMTAPWCGPCRMLAPRLQELEDEGLFTYFKVNVDENPELAREFRIMSIPTLIAYRNGESRKVIVGAKTKTQLLDELKDV